MRLNIYLKAQLHILIPPCVTQSVEGESACVLKFQLLFLFLSEITIFEFFLALREKRLKMEFFLVRIFLYLNWKRRFAEYISVFTPNEGKYGPEKTRYLDTLHVVLVLWKSFLPDGPFTQNIWITGLFLLQNLLKEGSDCMFYTFSVRVLFIS